MLQAPRGNTVVVSDDTTVVLQITSVESYYQFVRFHVSLCIAGTKHVDGRIKDLTDGFAVGCTESRGRFIVRAENVSDDISQVWHFIYSRPLPEPTDQWNDAVTNENKKVGYDGQSAMNNDPNLEPSQSAADRITTDADVAKAEAEARASVAKAEAQARADVAKAQAQANVDIAKAQAQANADAVALLAKANAEMADKWAAAFSNLTATSNYNNKLLAAGFANMNLSASYNTAVLANASQNVANNATYNTNVAANLA